MKNWFDRRAFVRMSARADVLCVPAHIAGPERGRTERKEHQLFGEDGFEQMVDQVASIEQRVGIYELAQFTPRG